MQRDIHPVRTVVATAVGALAGGVVAFFGGGQLNWMLLSDEPGSTRGLTSLGIAVVAAGFGTVGGAAAGVAVALRHLRGRGVTVATVLLAGVPVSVLGALAVAGAIELFGLHLLPSTLHIIVLAAVVFLPATAVLGRWLATRWHPDDGDAA